jgi:predicted short-subunit dehydrogenase-like oxidoreductase (DUF2520 family)
MKRVAIIGAGKLGQTIGHLLHHSSKYRVAAVWNPRFFRATRAARFIGRGVRPFRDIIKAAQTADIVFITTPDRVIKDICNQLADRGGIKAKALVIHCSGNFSSAILAKTGTCNAFVASVHPLQTFAEPKAMVKGFAGTYCTYEGDRPALNIVRDIINTAGGIAVKIKPQNKPLYHAAGVILSNYLVTLIHTGRNLLIRSGFRKAQAGRAFLPLVQGTINNIRSTGTPGALTGPIARGDTLTVAEHLRAIRKKMHSCLHFYKDLGKYTVSVARENKSISASRAQQLIKLFSRDKSV